MALTQAQQLDLVQRLATDDAFRHLFQQDNAQALIAIGIDPSAVSNHLDATQSECELADKATFAAVLQDMQNGDFSAAMAMQTPQVKIG
ncbi:MAG: NHLP-related RiPP peptide [Aquimonas sp.]|jgi:putative modified peptide|nr:NHLP-related RiPP peptide [Xanthomonadales bacterium]MCC6507024.1 NHLP-related RiPP peptide [Aquimonas sp.]